MFSVLSAAREICESYAFSFRTDISGTLIFDYNSGLSEHFGKDGHLIPISAGFWCSRMVDLNIVRQVFVCLSAMDAIAFLHFNAGRFNRSEELLFIAINPGRNYPQELSKELRKAKINVLLGNDLLDILHAIRFCMDYRGIKVCFTLQDELVVFSFYDHSLFIPQHELALRRFFLLAKIRPFFRQYVPKSKISFLHDFLNQ
ncbi:hypothetical protein [Pedobacter miscanthi]|uniref:hypothetical protein n=1 Tax=Pedobacter miscanthi TaxID=2259170 RepID=UPI0011BFB3E3|nr:hypothetical protein [Pedobacter miscanthi]